MSSSAGNSEITASVAAPPPQVARPESADAKAIRAAKAEVAISTPLRESITSLAAEADNEKAQTLQSISSVAEDIEEAIDTLNGALAQSPTKAIISRDEQLNRYIVRIADERSGEVIREIPSEAVLKFARNLQEIKGLLFDKAL
jgi:flagellar protein FlaG